MKIRCVVACHDVNGPNLYFVVVECNQEQYDEGEHYEAAQGYVEENYEVDGPYWVCDERDACGMALVQNFEWVNADEIYVDDGKVEGV